jgi:UDP-2,3-diacylglucosamine pyrophosphatase LpxH
MAERTKTRFIGDIHMGDERSFTASHPYGWFNDNIKILTQFLDEQLTTKDLKELVILGDLFDQWVVPVEYDPITSLNKICSYSANKDVISRLKKLAENTEIKLSYVLGNHDMGVSPSNISATRKFLYKTFPGIQVLGKPDVPLGVFRVGNLAAEHGNRYCLFNAPDPGSTPGDTYLPLGYFISRMVAHKVMTTGTEEDPLMILANLIRNLILDANFISAVIEAIAKDTNLPLKDGKIITKGIPGYPAAITVEEVKNRFSNLLKQWERTPENKISSLQAIGGDTGDLYTAAKTVYFSGWNPDVDIVIFGHTHKADLQRRLISGEDPLDSVSEGPCYNIYANTGTWVDKCDRGCTYVETEKNIREKQHHVRLIGYPGDSFIKNGYVLMR